MERRSRLLGARKRLITLLRLQRADEQEIEIRPATADSKHAARARELLEQPELERFRGKK